MSRLKLPLKGTQPEALVLGLVVDASATTTAATATNAGLDEGVYDATVRRSGNDFIISYDVAFERAPVVVATPVSATEHACTIAATATTGCTINVYSDAATAVTNVDFHVIVMGWDSPSQY